MITNYIRIKMKAIRLIVCLCFCCNSLFAQEEVEYGFIFPQFESGIVVFKNGMHTEAQLNYSMVKQTIMFIDNNKLILEFVEPLSIRVVIIGERRFFPVSSKGVFYEEINTGNGFYYVNYRALKESKGKESAYGGNSRLGATTALGNFSNDSSVRTMLKSNEKFTLRIEHDYYLKSDNSFKKFYSAKSLGKLFKGKASRIEKYAKEQSIDFSKTEDIAEIIEHAYNIQ